MSEEGTELVLRHGEVIAEGDLEQMDVGRKCGFVGDLSEAVPGASKEAVVTTENSVTDGAAEFVGNGAFVFDGEVRNATASVELVGGADGAGWASEDAALAAAAIVFCWLVGSER